MPVPSAATHPPPTRHRSWTFDGSEPAKHVILETGKPVILGLDPKIADGTIPPVVLLGMVGSSPTMTTGRDDGNGTTWSGLAS